nr:uncharacterized protein LOC118879115 isoform X2 [Drosophila suzukii]XP_036677996.1 uncharacterized protein LOC118879116 isoform X2 [Drosophila suzukii]XP_036678156.1 uncharacterized protein LOC118879395 isoform X2 [Drosophila suzukii]XP_036678158.1 uncharacterized protein LOC118879396 isoform X2 [Drosophila suzukii]
MQVLCARVQMNTAKELTNSTYRLCAVRTASAFRTISDDAALVIAGQVPLCELVREPQNQDRGEEECQDAERRQLAGSLGQLQQGTLDARVNRKQGQVDFYRTQALSGHGCFRSFLKRFGHDTENGCPECGSAIVEDDQHVLF